ncbi:hypothetical protein HNP37_003512 [Flavobacterium nitrogenifigens]|uniref:Uncharacterized protein n=2 Tax=Flavobacterium TaxID=237 RepID=A0A7W7IZK4_9FLAO|nr:MULTISPECIES: hypothetical protein [Flavobacterium]MBB4803437.1 hypothetical protein [Flavobacterium nitrogenifigens]MBB6388395.1 hypothetical protein [Flavobacterium notoginsengisoli]
MEPIEFFKLQAKNLLRDFKTKTTVSGNMASDFKYDYAPKYFHIYDVINDFNIDEENFSLMNAQHVIAKIAGFGKWSDLAGASFSELELAKLLFEYQDKIDILSWNLYIADAQAMNEQELDAEIQVGIFEQVVIEENIFDMEIQSYLLKHDY